MEWGAAAGGGRSLARRLQGKANQLARAILDEEPAVRQDHVRPGIALESVDVDCTPDLLPGLPERRPSVRQVPCRRYAPVFEKSAGQQVLAPDGTWPSSRDGGPGHPAALVKNRPLGMKPAPSLRSIPGDRPGSREAGFPFPSTVYRLPMIRYASLTAVVRDELRVASARTFFGPGPRCRMRGATRWLAASGLWSARSWIPGLLDINARRPPGGVQQCSKSRLPGGTLIGAAQTKSEDEDDDERDARAGCPCHEDRLLGQKLRGRPTTNVSFSQLCAAVMLTAMKNAIRQTPAALGYRMPAEWAPHAATWLSWPHNRESWPGKFEPIPGIWAQFARLLAQREDVHILASGEAVMAEARRMVGDHPRITLHDIPTNDAWMRDHGPTFLVGNSEDPPALVDWKYNAWGGKYPPFDADDSVPGLLAALLGRRRFQPGIILEGGAIDVNGQGTLLTTEQCLLNPNRNPGLSREDTERYLADYLGISNVLWLAGGIVGDDTDGHIDELARFVNETTVVAMLEEDPADDNFSALADNFRRLESFSDQDGRPLTVVPLPMPRPIFHEGQRLPASYANFYIANGLVVVPQYDDPADSIVLERLTTLFPDRQVKGVRAVDLTWGLGAFHCITQQEPATLTR